MTADDFEPQYDDDYADEGSGSILGPNGPRLLAERCETCIFRPGNLMRLRPGRVREMVTGALDAGTFITCHSTLYRTGVGPAICRGFFDLYGHSSNLIRIYGRIGGFDEIPPPAC